MANADMPLVVCVSSDVDVRERLVRRLDDCGVLVMCAGLDDLRAMLGPATTPPAWEATDASAAAPMGPVAGVPAMPGIAPAPALVGTPWVGLTPTAPRGVISVGDLVVDPAGHLVTWRGLPLPLTKLERELLGSLATPPVAVWTYERLFGTVWGSAYLGDTSILHSAVKRLRRKLRDLGAGPTIETVRGVGYRLAVP